MDVFKLNCLCNEGICQKKLYHTFANTQFRIHIRINKNISIYYTVALAELKHINLKTDTHKFTFI